MGRELKNEFSWSFSRDATYLECARRYFFQYYGAWGGWAAGGDPKARELYVLKQLSNRAQWAGSKVHEAIEQLLVEVRDGLATPSEEETVQRALTAMRQDFKDSRAARYRAEPKKRCGLFEHEYALEVPDAAWKETADHVAQCLRTFYQSKVFAGIRALPRDAWLEVEQLRTFDVDRIKVWVCLDLAFRKDGLIHIFDWKTGRAPDADHAMQMACYTLYACGAWKVEPDLVRTYAFNLASDTVTPVTVDREAVAEAREYIAASAGEMQVFLDDPDHNVASEDAFPLAEDEAACRMCNFLKVCPKWAT